MFRPHHALLPLLPAFFLAGCGKEEPVAPPGKSTVSAPPAAGSGKAEVPASKTRVTDRNPNHEGQVFVAEWHQIRDGKNSMFRSAAKFRSDLQRLHKMGFRPVTATQYLTGKMDLPPGASPVVMTFDDSPKTQFALSADGSVDPKCAVGIWLDFAKSHPDFPVRATFFVLPDTMFGQPKALEKKLAMLKEWGCEIANHTVTHRSLRSLNAAAVGKEIADANATLEKHGAEGPHPMALPMGISPRDRKLLDRPDLSGVFLVGAGPAPAPGPKLDAVKTRIPRIQSYDGELSLNEWLDAAAKGRVKLYVE